MSSEVKSKDPFSEYFMNTYIKIYRITKETKYVKYIEPSI